MNEILERVCAGESLTRREVGEVFGEIIGGDVPEPIIAALVTALKIKGETPDEVAGAADALLEAAAPFPTFDGPCVDTCGTGGDGAGTVNISTAVALVCAEMGVKVAKHGNRSVSSNCGSADVLEQLGVRLDAPAEVSARCLDEANICFLFAPQFHSGVRHAMPVRRALGVRTIFNILGPLVNPARPSHQLLGVYSRELCEPMAHTLAALGTTEAMVVHGSGLDEIAAHGKTTVAHLRAGEVTLRELSPADFGVDAIDLDDLKGSGPQTNARWLRDALAGRARRTQNIAIAVNVAAVLSLMNRHDNLKEATEHALDTICSGRATHRLNRFVEMSHGVA